MELMHKNKFIIIISPILLSIIYKLYTNQYIIPNLLLFTGFRETTRYYWHKINDIDEKIIYEPQHISIIQKEDYSFEVLKKASNNFREPVVVKGLFIDTPAINKWNNPDYLPSIIGKIKLSVIPNATYGTLQNNRYISNFTEIFTEIINNADSKKYLFFPTNTRVYNTDVEKINYKLQNLVYNNNNNKHQLI
jgi:hypothetical protein